MFRKHFTALAVMAALCAPALGHEGPHLSDETTEQQATTATDAVIRGLRDLENAPPNARARYEQALQRSIEQRAAALYALTERNPRLVWLKALPAALREKVPASMRAAIEQEVDAQGTVIGRIADDFANGRAQHQFFLDVTDGSTTRRINIDVADRGLTQDDLLKLTGRRIKARGLLLQDHLVIGDRRGVQLVALDGTTTNTVTPTTTPVVTGDQPTLVIIGSLQDKANTCTASGLGTSMFSGAASVNALYRESSRDQVSFSGTVVGPFTIPYSSAACEYSAWATALDAAAKAAGVTLTNYRRISYNMPPNSACGWSGLAYMPGSRSWVNTCSAGVFAHELGHNLSLHHAATPTSEYGDGSDPMGGARMVQFNAANRVMAGWQPTGTFQDVVGTGSFTLTSVSLTSSFSPQVLRIRKADTSEYYYVSMRTGAGFDANLSGYKGLVTVHRASGTLPSKTVILAQLAAGQSYADTTNGIQITASTIDAVNGGATVAVAMNTPACTAAAPGVAVSPASQTASPGLARTYTMTVSNRNSASCPSSTFALAQTLPAGFSGTFSPASLTLASGASANVSWSVTSPSTAADASYPLSAAVTEALSKGAGAANASYVVFRDTSAPAVTITSPMQGSILTRGTITVNASATDSNGVASVSFHVDGKLLGSDTSAPYSMKWNARKAAVGNHTISVTATDSAGNTSTPVSVSVTLR